MTNILLQHVEDSAMLRHVRSVLARAPHVKLHHLRRLDDRIAANLDGIAVAGSTGRELCCEALEAPGHGQAFALTAAALEAADLARLQGVLTLARVVPAVRRGLLSALGWWPATQVLRQLHSLVASPDAGLREIGLSAHRLHGLDPGRTLAESLNDADTALRASAARTAGELGRVDLADTLLAMLSDADPEVALHAARAACLLGRRRKALESLRQAQGGSSPRAGALALLIQSTDLAQAQDIVRAVAKESSPLTPTRLLIRAAGWLGDAALVPWLIDLMEQPKLTRLAGESFTLITGADLAALDLEVKPPEEPIAGPNDDPADDNVALDEDDSLPWPDVVKLKAWWLARRDRFPAGQRYFVGAPISVAQARHVLKAGTQRQRALAAQWLCLLQPGTPLFNIAAPAWRQQQALAALA